MAKDDMVAISFRLKPEEQRLVERRAKNEGITVSAYIRRAVLFDMVMEGDWDAFKHLASEVRTEVLKRMTRRFGFLSAETSPRAD